MMTGTISTRLLSQLRIVSYNSICLALLKRSIADWAAPLAVEKSLRSKAWLAMSSCAFACCISEELGYEPEGDVVFFRPSAAPSS